MLTCDKNRIFEALMSLLVLLILLGGTAVPATAQGFGLAFKVSDIKTDGQTITVRMDTDALQGIFPSRSVVATCRQVCRDGQTNGVFLKVEGEYMAALNVVPLSGRRPAERAGYGLFRFVMSGDGFVLGAGPGGVVPRDLARAPVPVSLSGSCADFKAGKALLVLGDGNAVVQTPVSTQLYYPAGLPSC